MYRLHRSLQPLERFREKGARCVSLTGALMMISIFAACNDAARADRLAATDALTAPASKGTPRPGAYDPTPGAERTTLASFEHRNDLRIDVDGAFKPKLPLTIRFEAIGLRASASTRVRLTIVNGEPNVTPRNVIVDTRVPIAAKEIVSFTRTFTFSEPGYYAIRALSQADPGADPRPEAERMLPLSGDNSAVVWLLITAGGGQLDRRYDSSWSDGKSDRYLEGGGLGAFRSYARALRDIGDAGR